MDKYHILVVDDNHINRLFFESSLKKLGMQVSLAENGFVAIDLCRKNQFDLILMDIRMDGLDGTQTAAEIKSITDHLKTPILAVSAERFDISNHSDFALSLLKPINQEKLKTVVNHYLQAGIDKLMVFDDSKALQISHHDETIVFKLRQILINQLPTDWAQIEYLYENQQFNELSAQLHKLMGSAKICAASRLFFAIEKLKICVDSEQLDFEALQDLKSVITETIDLANKSATP